MAASHTLSATGRYATHLLSALSGLCVLVALTSSAFAQELSPPELIELVEAAYPDAALAEGLTARVSAALFIDAAGDVVKVELSEPAEPAGYGFDEAAIAAMRQWKFAPARRAGAPIASRVQFSYDFVPPPPEPVEEPIEDVVEEPIGEPDTVEPPAPVLSVEGEVVEAGTRRRLAGVLVTFERDGEAFEAYTDELGRLELLGLAPGTWNVTVEEEEFGSFVSEEEVREGEVTEVTYYLERNFYDAYGTDGAYVYETRAKRVKKDVNRRTLDVVEIQRIPGNQGDALKVVQNLPGVARSSFNSGQLVVRGSAPQDTIVFLDGAPIPLLYHFGGLTSVVNSDVLSSIDFYPGNFSARYGRAMGGILDVKTRPPRRDRITGYADVDLIDTSVLLEGPVTDDISVQISARRSYIDAILPAVIPDDAGVSLTVAPRYWDYQGRVNWRVAPQHELEFFSYGSDDLLEFLIEEPPPQNPLVRGDIEVGTSFHRGQLSYRYRGKRLDSTFVYNFGTTLLNFSAGDFARFTLDIFQHVFREELRYEATRKLTLLAGWDIALSDTNVTARLPQQPREGEFAGGFESRRFVSLTSAAVYYTPAAFIEAELEASEPLLIVLGSRLGYDNFTEEFGADLRSTFRYDLSGQVTIKGGVGSFSQPPQPQEVVVEEFGNPDLRWQRAVHYALGTEFRLPFYEPVNYDLTVFYKDMESLVTASPNTIVRDGEAVPENLNNGGIGRVYGVEALVRHELANNVFGWISYTLSRAERADAQGEAYDPFQYDQTHILTIIASWKLPAQWQVGARFRYVTGAPYTPRAGSVFDADADDYQWIPGPELSKRLEAFHQLDVRVDKSWVFDTWILSAYLDVQGVYFHGNVEAVQYNYDSTEQSYVRNLPILPTFGVKGEF